MKGITGYAGFLLGLILLVAQQMVAAQTTGVDSSLSENIGRGFSDSLDEPSFDIEFETEVETEKKRVLPEVTPAPAEGPSARQLIISEPFDVGNITLLGNTALPQEDIDQVIAPFENRRLQPEYVQELRQRLSLLYFNAGYINSGVVVPEQDVTEGTLQLQVIEGSLNSVELSGNRKLSDKYIQSRLLRSVDSPLNLNDLQESLRQLELNPLIRRVNGQLLPGLAPGEARLKLDVLEDLPYNVALSFDNYRSPSVGAERAVLSLQHRNITGHADSLQLSGSISEGLEDSYIGYELPVSSADTLLALEYRRGGSEVIEAPFDDLDIESDTESWGVSLTHPFINRLNRKFSLSLSFSHSSSETELDGFPFSFSLGAQSGESKSSNIGLGLEWIERWGDQVLAARTTLRQGINAFGSTTIPEGGFSVDPTTGAEIPDTRFTALVTQLQYARRLSWQNSQLVLSATWQEAFDPLLSVEKYAVGGAFSVRGFRENQLVRDNGVSASLEMRIPLFLSENGYDKWRLKLIPFIDYGRSWDEDSNLSTSNAATISSLGIGLNWQPIRAFSANLYYGEAIDDDDVSSPGEYDLQDDGLHFSLRFSWPFK